MKIVVFLLLSLFAGTYCQSSEPIEVLSLLQSLSTYLGSVWTEEFLLPQDMSSRPEWSYLSGGYNLSLDVADSDAILEQYEKVSSRIDRISLSIKDIEQDIRIMQDALPAEVNMEVFLSHVRTIDGFYERLAEYKHYAGNIEQLTVADLAQSIVSHLPGSVRSAMEQLHNHILPLVPGDHAFFDYLRNYAMVEEHGCGMRSSPLQLVYSFFKLLALSQLKGFTMMQFSWLLLRSFDKGTFQYEAQLQQENFIPQVAQEFQIGKVAFANVSSKFWKCDPTSFSEGNNFIALKKLLQGYVENEVDMNDYSSCMRSCNSYDLAKHQRCYKGRKFQLCKHQQKCSGEIRTCQFYDSDMEICLSYKPDRRYGWIKYKDNKKHLGKISESCLAEKKVEGWWRYFVHCSYCLCICDDKDGDTDRYFDLRSLEADINDNRVITGFQLAKTNGIIHIKIQTGKAFPSGEIDPDSVKWDNVNALNFKDNITAGVDYFKMSWEERGIDFDDLRVPQGYAITGVKFKVLGGHVGLMIRATKISFETGMLNENASLWISSDETAISENSRYAIYLDDVDVPTLTPEPSPMRIIHNQYLHFTHTSIEKDVAQTTVPYFDSQPVAPNPAVWLTGAGLYYKGMAGYGGFVGLQVSTPSLAPHVDIAV